jgi:hypothetical protein
MGLSEAPLFKEGSKTLNLYLSILNWLNSEEG